MPVLEFLPKFSINQSSLFKVDTNLHVDVKELGIYPNS